MSATVVLKENVRAQARDYRIEGGVLAPIIFLGGDLTVSLGQPSSWRSSPVVVEQALGMRDYSGPNPQFLSGSLRRLGLPAALFLSAAPPSRPENLRIANQVLSAAPPKQAGKPTNCQPSGHAGSGQGRVRGELETVEGVGEDGRGALRTSRTNGSRPSSGLSSCTVHIGRHWVLNFSQSGERLIHEIFLDLLRALIDILADGRNPAYARTNVGAPP